METEPSAKTFGSVTGSVIATGTGGGQIAVATNERTVHVWDMKTGNALPVLQQTAAVTCLCISPDASHLVIGNQEGGVTAYRMPGPDQIWENPVVIREPDGKSAALTAITFTSSGRRLVLANESGGIAIGLFSENYYQELLTLPGHPNAVHSLSFSAEAAPTLLTADSSRAIARFARNWADFNNTATTEMATP